MNLRSLDIPIRINREAEFAPSSFDAERNEISIVWTTGAAVTRRGWDGPYSEELDLDGVRLDFMNSGRAPFLDSHNARSVEAVIGRIVEGSAKIEGGRGVATVRLSAAAQHAGIVENIRAGIVRNVSVGYDVHAVEEIGATASSMKIIRATDWEPLEVSAVPIGADPDAQTRSLADAIRAPEPTTTESEMSEETPPTVVETPAPQINADEIRSQERSRILSIRTTASKLNISGEEVDKLVADGTSVDAARAALIDLKAKADVKISSHVTAGAQDAGETRGQAMIDAILYRANPDKAPRPESEIGRRYATMTMAELAREGLSWHGIKTDGMSRSSMMSSALQVRGGMHTTSDFPLILAEVTGKRLMMGYDESPATFAPFCRRTTATDFKTIRSLQLGELPTLPVVNEHGEYKRVTLSESQETYSIKRYGSIVSITAQAMINDDLSAFSSLPMKFGAAARRMEQDVVWGLITANGTMSNGRAVFNTTDNTLLAAGAAPDQDEISAMRNAIRLQTGLDGTTVLNLRGAFILAPVILETAFEQLLYTPFNPTTAAATVPASMQRLQLITDPRLDANSALAYYMVAAPSDVDTIEYAYLSGEEGPVVENKLGWDIDGVEVKIHEDFGAGVIDRRPFVKNPGT